MYGGRVISTLYCLLFDCLFKRCFCVFNTPPFGRFLLLLSLALGIEKKTLGYVCLRAATVVHRASLVEVFFTRLHRDT